MSNPGATRLLQNQLKDLKESTHLSFISAGLKNDNIFEWELVMMLPDDIDLYGGTFTWNAVLGGVCRNPLYLAGKRDSNLGGYGISFRDEG